MRFSYARQKAREALECLMADASLDTRLQNAGGALGLLPIRELTAEVARMATVVQRAFTRYPEAWRERPGWAGDIAALIDLLPYARKRRLVEMTTDMFEAICLADSTGHPLAGKTGAPELSSPDKWEFLFWGLDHSDSQALRDKYVAYAQTWLPNFPAAVLLEWPGRHGYHGFQNWAHLELERLIFDETQMPIEELRKIQAIDAGFAESGPDSYGEFHLNRQGDWIGEYIRKYGTWSAPIIVLQQDEATVIHGRTIEPGFVLIEGHQRLSRLLNYQDAGVGSHKVMLGRVADGQ